MASQRDLSRATQGLLPIRAYPLRIAVQAGLMVGFGFAASSGFRPALRSSCSLVRRNACHWSAGIDPPVAACSAGGGGGALSGLRTTGLVVAALRTAAAGRFLRHHGLAHAFDLEGAACPEDVHVGHAAARRSALENCRGDRLDFDDDLVGAGVAPCR